MARKEPLCIVPARGVEPSLPKRNFKHIGGKPLIAHTIETALECEALNDVFLSTESEQLAEIAREYGATVPFLRPEKLTKKAVSLDEVITHAIDRLSEEGYAITEEMPVVILQPNIPFRRASDIIRALETFEQGHDSVISVVEKQNLYWREDGETLTPQYEERVNREKVEPIYRETGSINVTTPHMLTQENRIGDAPGYIITDRMSSLVIDSVLDLLVADRLANGPKAVLRVDGGNDIGMGHVSRCLTLARYLENQLRCQIAFVSSTAYPEGVEYIRNAGYEVQAVDSNPLGVVRDLDPDIVVVDALNTDPDRMRRLHEEAAAVISLEDTDGGVIYGDFVINALYQDSESKANHFAGPDYFVLREEFWEVEPRLPDTAERVLLTFGGSDPTATSVLACRALACDTDRTYRLILGPEFDHWNELNAALTDCPNVEVFHDIDKIGEQMAWADMAVASAGRTAYELAATGTPALLVAHNAREHNRGQFLDDQGVAEYPGRAENLSPEKLRRAVNEIAENQALRSEISERGQTFIDGNGARRILDLIHDLLLR